MTKDVRANGDCLHGCGSRVSTDLKKHRLEKAGRGNDDAGLSEGRSRVWHATVRFEEVRYATYLGRPRSRCDMRYTTCRQLCVQSPAANPLHPRGEDGRYYRNSFA